MTARGRAALPYLYLLPAFLFFVPFVLVPFAHTVGLSFYDWDGLTQAAFTGFDNYREAFAQRAGAVGLRPCARSHILLRCAPRLAGPAACREQRAGERPGRQRASNPDLPAASDIHGRGRGELGLDPGPGRPTQCRIARTGPRLGCGRLARELHLGSAKPRHRRHVDADRIVRRPVFRGPPADSGLALRCGGSRRGRTLAGIPGRHLAGPQGTDHRRADRHRHLRAARIRSRVRDDARRPGHGDRRAGDPDLSARFRRRPAGLRGGDCRDTEHRRVRRDLPHQPDFGPETRRDRCADERGPGAPRS